VVIELLILLIIQKKNFWFSWWWCWFNVLFTDWPPPNLWETRLFVMVLLPPL
jgi:hypothetical protein